MDANEYFQYQGLVKEIMKKVLIVITTRFVSYGGLTTVAMNYYRNISSVHMDFASTNAVSQILEDELTERGSVYYQLPPRTNVVAYYQRLKGVCRGYDIIHVHANSATSAVELMAAKKVGVKERIVHIHNTTCDHTKIHNVLKPLFDRLYTKGIACSKAAGEWIFTKTGFEILNNAIDVQQYKFDKSDRFEVRHMYSIGEDSVVIGHVGKFVAQKNHGFLIDCFSLIFKSVPDSYLLLVGDGKLRKEIEQKVSSLGLSNHVIFSGMVDTSAAYLSAMDCLVFPSRWEGLPLSVLEAQANGLKCIISDKITPEVAVTGLVNFLNIADSAEMWAQKTLNNIRYDRFAASSKGIYELRKNNYDVLYNAHVLEKIYTEY